MWLRDTGVPHDVVAAAVGGAKPSVAVKRRTAQELTELAGSPALARVLEAHTRAARMARSANAGGEVDPALFETPQETELWSALQTVEADASLLRSVKDLIIAFDPLVDPIHAFFEHVFVMADDQRVADNRLTLLNRIATLPTPLADLTRLRVASADEGKDAPLKA